MAPTSPKGTPLCLHLGRWGHLSAGAEQEKTVLLCVLGAREDGEKELLAMAPGYRESTESWADVMRDLRDRGLAPPLHADR